MFARNEGGHVNSSKTFFNSACLSFIFTHVRSVSSIRHIRSGGGGGGGSRLDDNRLDNMPERARMWLFLSALSLSLCV